MECKRGRQTGGRESRRETINLREEDRERERERGE